MVDAFDNVNTPDRLNIIQMVKEINIYEDITKPFISGNLTVVDANNIFEMLPIAGFERLEMQLMSPGLLTTITTLQLKQVPTIYLFCY